MNAMTVDDYPAIPSDGCAAQRISTLRIMRIVVLRKRFSALVTGFVIAGHSGCSSLPNSSQVEYEGSKISIAHKSGKSPIVVFQSGLGNGMSVWSAVLQRLPSDVGTFAYDRPGYGGSFSKPGERDPCSIAHELHELLRIADVRPPYILVGHSLGGIYQYAFARLYPKEVSGMLLVDATHPEQWENMQRRAPNTAAMMRGMRAVAFSDTERREFDAQATCISELQTNDPPSAPARLLSRGKADLTESAEFQAMSRELASRWPELLPGLTMLRAEGAGHFIQKDRPEFVATEIGMLVSTERNKQR
jgi:pimeloyl-ACP methyl ester carboxylesterase